MGLVLGRGVPDGIYDFQIASTRRIGEQRKKGLPESTNRPSASVLSTSTDLPFMAYTLRKQVDQLNT
jgi:hypothetical protein